ncbi:hypothetical protein DIPPA_21476 [Diplonema papillatum]|nr:hypothetical protein DIPPA_21476 [Diplonema papillatum]
MPPNSNWTTREWTVDKIIASFKEALRKRAYIMKKESSSNDVFLSTLTGQINADIVSLLYDHEADVHEKVLAQRQPLVPWTSVYGVEILARLLVKLPSLLQPDTPDDKYTAVILAAEELLQYLDQHWSQIVGYT